MPTKKLKNYLRTHRRRFGLSQSDVAYLLGCESADQAKVARYERLATLPSLKTALAYEVLFDVPVAKLFAGLYKQVERETSKRARILQRRLLKARPNRISTRKANLLRAVEISPDIDKDNQ
jgi:transcriptional regulator with XRE-family HTH domain